MKEAKITMKAASTLLGFPPSAIRCYERYNRSKRYDVDGNGYRIFPFESISQLFALKQLSRMGMTLRDASMAMSNSDFVSHSDTLDECESSISRQIRYLQAVREVVDESRLLLAKARDSTNVFEETLSPDMYHLVCEENESVIGDRATQRTMRQWAEHIPLVFFAPFVEGPEFSGDSAARIGMGVAERHAQFLALDNEHVSRVPERKCLGGVVRVERIDIGRDALPLESLYYDVIRPGLDCARNRGLEVSGNIITRLIAADILESNGSRSDYYYAWYPLR